MAQPFPNHPNLRGGFAPLQIECDANDLVIEGEIPRELNGSFYRNGPNPQYAPRGHYHWFGGDGMVHAFHIENANFNFAHFTFVVTICKSLGNSRYELGVTRPIVRNESTIIVFFGKARKECKK